jgi:hypothetical protein
MRYFDHGDLEALIENGADAPELRKRERGIFAGEFEDQLHPDLICGRD